MWGARVLLLAKQSLTFSLLFRFHSVLMVRGRDTKMVTQPNTATTAVIIHRQMVQLSMPGPDLSGTGDKTFLSPQGGGFLPVLLPNPEPHPEARGTSIVSKLSL